MSLAVVFGAGNIGRGFIAQLCYEAGMRIMFIDTAEAVVDRINMEGAYTIHIVGPGAEEIEIDRICAEHSRNLEAVADHIAGCDIVFTAVGAAALPHIATPLAVGLVARVQRGDADPLNVVLCENLHDAPSSLQNAVAAEAGEAWNNALLQVGFVHAVVSRMAPVATAEQRAARPLDVWVEAYKTLPIDAAVVVQPLPNIPCVVQARNFAALEERKLYTHNCAHAVLGYLGHEGGYGFAYEALNDTYIATTLAGVMAETGEALVRKHGFDQAEQAAYEADLLARFQNRALGDTCIRLARDPIRKLAMTDRLVGAAHLCESQGIAPSALAQVIATALSYREESDPSANALSHMMEALGAESTLEQVCGITPDEPLGRLILSAYESRRTHASRL